MNRATITWINHDRGFGFAKSDTHEYFFHVQGRREQVQTRHGVRYLQTDKQSEDLSEGSQILVLEEGAGQDPRKPFRKTAVEWVPKEELVLYLFCVIQTTYESVESDPVCDNDRKVFRTVVVDTHRENVIFVGTKEDAECVLKRYPGSRIQAVGA